MKAEDALQKLPSATVYYTHGSNLFLKYQIRKRVERAYPSLLKTVVFGDDEEIFDKAECGGLIPEPRLIVVEEFSELKNKKGFFELINRAAQGSVYLLQGEKKEKISVERELTEIECPSKKINEREFLLAVKGWLSKSSFQINDSALKRIFNLTGGDLFYAYNEIKKLALYAEATNSAHLSPAEIQTIMGPKIDADPFLFSTLYLQKNRRACLQEVAKWKSSDLMLHLYNHFKAVEKALLAKTCKELGMSAESVSAQTGIPSWYYKFVFPDIEAKWTKLELIEALKDCAEAIEKAKRVANLAIPVIVQSVLRRNKYGGSVE